MEHLNIHYRFCFDDASFESFYLKLDRETLVLQNWEDASSPEWTWLTYEQCPHCPLTAVGERTCPLAVALAPVLDRFAQVASFDEVDLEVVTAERKVSQRTTAQRGLSSLLGLLSAVCGCPMTAFFRPMARFHLPLASETETVFRAVGMYLLAHYYRSRGHAGNGVDLTGLKQIYADLHRLNVAFARRIRRVADEDASVNAIILLDMFTSALPMAVDEHLAELRPLFAAYLSEEGNRNDSF